MYVDSGRKKNCTRFYLRRCGRSVWSNESGIDVTQCPIMTGNNLSYRAASAEFPSPLLVVSAEVATIVAPIIVCLPASVCSHSSKSLFANVDTFGQPQLQSCLIVSIKFFWAKSSLLNCKLRSFSRWLVSSAGLLWSWAAKIAAAHFRISGSVCQIPRN